MLRRSQFLYPDNILRCQHIKINGVQCGSPALKNRAYCHFHYECHQAGLTPRRGRRQNNDFLFNAPLEDANSIQLALMRVMQLIYTGKLDQKRGALLLYALQTASANLRHTEFEPKPEQVVIDKSQVGDTNLGDPAWFKSEFADTDPRCIEEAREKKEQEEARAREQQAREDRLDAAAEEKERKWQQRLMHDAEEECRKRDQAMQPVMNDPAESQAGAAFASSMRQSLDPPARKPPQPETPAVPSGASESAGP